MLNARQWRLRILSVFFLLLILSWVWPLTGTWLSWRSVTQGHYATAALTAKKTIPFIGAWSFLTLHQIPDLEIWLTSVYLLTQVDQVPQLPTLIDQTQLSLKDQTQAQTLKTWLQPKLSDIQKIVDLYPRSIIKRVLPQKYQAEFSQLQAFLPGVSELLTGDQTWAVIFQNSQELRATGGFMGSLAIVHLHEGSVTQLETQDIYQPAGQISQFIPAPEAVNQYLSAGSGWHLPDMNWSPDFPLSAQQITSALDLAGIKNVDGIVAVNLELAQELLRVTGPIYVPDYQETVTPETLASVLRQDRDSFFPGSVAKQHILASFLTQFKTKLLAADFSQVLNVWRSAIPTKNVQIFAQNQALETTIKSLGAAGQLPDSTPARFYIFPVESNVGINKANQAVTRTWKLDLAQFGSHLKITFDNTNPHSAPTASSSATLLAAAPHLHYVNYQRLLIKPDMNVVSLLFNQQPITNFSESIITTSNGEQLKEISFLIVVMENSTADLDIGISHPTLNDESALALGKQAGTGLVPVTIQYKNESHPFDLERDQLLKLNHLP